MFLAIPLITAALGGGEGYPGPTITIQAAYSIVTAFGTWLLLEASKTWKEDAESNKDEAHPESKPH
jgi:hypothetical protein